MHVLTLLQGPIGPLLLPASLLLLLSPISKPRPSLCIAPGMPTDPAVLERLEKYLAAFAEFLKAHKK